MNNLTSGKKRHSDDNKKSDILCDIMFFGGLCLMCAMLIIPMIYSTEKVNHKDNVVSAMSSGVTVREELSTPKSPVSADEWSFFDSVGELFAELIFGEE